MVAEALTGSTAAVLSNVARHAPGAEAALRLAEGKAVALDERTVRFDLKQPGLDAIFSTAEMPVFSAKWGAGKLFNEIVTEQPIATGPYTIDKIEMPRRVFVVPLAIFLPRPRHALRRDAQPQHRG